MRVLLYTHSNNAQGQEERHVAKMVEITCACGCGVKKQVREADRKRGWGKYASKSCKARAQERRTGQHRAPLNRGHRSGAQDSIELTSTGDTGSTTRTTRTHILSVQKH